MPGTPSITGLCRRKWQDQWSVARRTGDSVGSYLRDEAGVGVRAAAGSDRSEAIAALTERVDRLGERVALLSDRGGIAS